MNPSLVRYIEDENILYAAAACHNLGLAVDRKTHHLESGKIIRRTVLDPIRIKEATIFTEETGNS